MKPINSVPEKEEKMWTRECPVKADAGDAYYFVRRLDRNEVVVMGFSMGKGWLNGVSYEASEMRSHLFLGPLLPSDTEELLALREEVERLRRICDVALKGVGAPIMHNLAQEALSQLRTARPKD